MTPTLASIITIIEKEQDVKKQATLLKKYSSPGLKAILGYAMDPGVKWLLPETDPPYKSIGGGMDMEGRLYHEARKFIYFVDSPEGRTLKALKREQMFIALLETIDPDDAHLMLRVKNKNLKGIKLEAVKKAFPNLTKGW